MRICVGILATATVLFAAGAVGSLGTWSLAVSTVLGLIGAMATVTIMEEREHAAGVVVSLADRHRPAAESTSELVGELAG
jgi:hypothetical protein